MNEFIALELAHQRYDDISMRVRSAQLARELRHTRRPTRGSPAPDVGAVSEDVVGSRPESERAVELVR